MSSGSKGKKRSRQDDKDDDKDTLPATKKKSLVDYSRVASRPEPTTGPRRRGGAEAAHPAAALAASKAPAPPKMSAQMEAVVRLMTGKEERTIAEKLADSNRPTWEQYKKDNEDKLNLEGVGQQKMEEYRRELDAEREKRLARGLNHGGKKDKKKKKKKHHSESEDSSDSDDERRRRKHKKHKKKKDRKKRRQHGSDSDESSDKLKKKKKKKKSKSDNKDSGEESDGSHYRLSKFFTAGSSSDDDDT